MCATHWLAQLGALNEAGEAYAGKGHARPVFSFAASSTLARQIEMGIVPKGTKLAPRAEGIKDWESLSPKEKQLYAHQYEVFAGFAEYTDHEVGRLIDALRDMGE